MAGDLFDDLPPPTAAQSLEIVHNSADNSARESLLEPPPPAPALKSALKRPKQSAPPEPALKSSLKRPKLPPESQPEAAPEKRLRFKTTTDASEEQVIDAMQKIASHIKNPTKFSKASKLAMQLIQAGSIKEATSGYFFTVLEAAMMPLTKCNEPLLRADYHALFSAAQDVAEVFNKKQQNLLNAWAIRAVWANDLFTDDSFMFSKAAGRLKEAISALPVATEDEDKEEAIALRDEATEIKEPSLSTSSDDYREEEPDPFGLDAFLSNPTKGEKSKGQKELPPSIRKDDEEENARFLKSQREALISCLEIAANRYKTPWCQTTIDILAKHAFDNVSRFTTRQRDAIGKLWNSIRDQLTRRKQGKSVSGKLDVNAFEWLQQKYSTEKISIRHSVGGSGDRKCQQWLG